MPSFFSFWIATPLMAAEFLLYGFLYALRMKRQEYFWIRFSLLSFLELGAVFVGELLLSIFTEGQYYYGEVTEWDYRITIMRFFFFLLIYLMTFLVLMASYKTRPSTIFLIAAASFASQHIAYNAYLILGHSFMGIETELAGVLHVILRIFISLAGLALSLFFNLRTGERANPYEGNTKKKVAASSVVVLLCIGIFRIQSDLPSTSLASSIGLSLYAIISCALLLLLFFGLWESDRTHAEADAYREMVHVQKEQYERSKKSIELINIKCHDLKHQIQALRTNENAPSVKELEHEIMIYDSAVHTGNEVLDVILREKQLQCEAEGITMTCLLDGSAISFMEEMDIYSFFGNLLSNAIEAASKLEDKSRRVISLSGRKVGNMFFLHEDNHYAEEPHLVESLPQTTKNADDLHGFGMKSMERTAKKYGGEMTFRFESGKFSIDFVFPLKA